MAVKDVQEYYNKICQDRLDAIQNIKEFEIECSNGLVEPERVEQLKHTMAPLMQNYEQISYIMYLLNKPKRKEKQKIYEKSVGKKLKQTLNDSNSTEAKLLENQEVLKRLKILTTKK